METAVSINEWARATFGAGNPLEAATRCNIELAELISVIVCQPDNKEEIEGELADVYIVLCQVPQILGLSMPKGLGNECVLSQDNVHVCLRLSTSLNNILCALNSFEEHTCKAFEEKILMHVTWAVTYLNCLADLFQINLQRGIDQKMEINRSRNWMRLETGRFQHA